MAFNSFAERLTQLRIEKGLKREYVAKVLGCSVSAIGNYENGNRTPDFDGLIKLAELFSTTTDYLLGRTDIVTSDKNLEFVCEHTGLSEKAIRVLHLLAKEKTSRVEFEKFLVKRIKESESCQIDNDTITDGNNSVSADYETKVHSIDVVNYLIEKLNIAYKILDTLKDITNLKYLDGGIGDETEMEDTIIEKDPDLYDYIYRHSILLTGVEHRRYLEEQAVNIFHKLVSDFAFDYAPYENERHLHYQDFFLDEDLEENVNMSIKFYEYRMEHYDETEEQLKSALYDKGGANNGNNPKEE